MADVIALVADGIATNCYMADVIAIVADGIATNYCKWFDSVADGIAATMLADVFANMMADVIATCGRWNGTCFLIRLLLLLLWQVE